MRNVSARGQRFLSLQADLDEGESLPEGRLVSVGCEQGELGGWKGPCSGFAFPSPPLDHCPVRAETGAVPCSSPSSQERAGPDGCCMASASDFPCSVPMVVQVLMTLLLCSPVRCLCRSVHLSQVPLLFSFSEGRLTSPVSGFSAGPQCASHVLSKLFLVS